MTQVTDSPIFIVGAARSGTTLLQYMVRSHPRISLPTGESHFIVPMLQRAAEFGDLSREENITRVLEAIYARHRYFLDDELHGVKFAVPSMASALVERGVTDMTSLIDGIFQVNAAGEGKSRWGDKTPYYALHLERLLDAYPDAQVIHIVRDGRDCALSMLERKFDLRIFNIHEAAEIWMQYVCAAREAGKKFGPERYFEFRYEDLTKDPETTMRAICAFLNEEYSDETVNYRKAADSGDGPLKTPLLQQPVQSQNSEKWRSNMSSWDQRIFESVAGDVLIDSGYSLSKPDPEPLLFPVVSTAYKVHGRLMRLRAG
ncbi:MAG: sulfotransferase [Gammaproteobacteria bacterium]|nr:sulfotransferase [Gammaproteobacteria bacterium]